MKMYYIVRNGEKHGPFPLSYVDNVRRSGKLKPDDQVIAAGDSAPSRPRKRVRPIRNKVKEKNWLLDYKFDTFVLPKLVAALWLAWLITAGLSVISATFTIIIELKNYFTGHNTVDAVLDNAATAASDQTVVALGLIISALFSTILVRVGCETLIVLFKIAENTSKLEKESTSK